MQAEGGLMSVTGDPDRPSISPRRGDHRHGGRPVLRAGHHGGAARARDDRASASASTSGCSTRPPPCSPTRPANWFATGKIPPRQGNRHATIAPYETFTTSDGEIVIAVGNDGTWQKFCPAIGLPELAGDPRFTSNKDRMENYDAMRPPIERAFKTATSAEWIARSERRRCRQRRSAKHRADAERPAARGAPHDRDADAPHRRRHQGDRRADQVLGESGEPADAAARYSDSTLMRC